MRSWFTECESCQVLTARVSGLCLSCEVAREEAMERHPSNARIRHVSRHHRRAHSAA